MFLTSARRCTCRGCFFVAIVVHIMHCLCCSMLPCIINLQVNRLVSRNLADVVDMHVPWKGRHTSGSQICGIHTVDFPINVHHALGHQLQLLQRHDKLSWKWGIFLSISWLQFVMATDGGTPCCFPCFCALHEIPMQRQCSSVLSYLGSLCLMPTWPRCLNNAVIDSKLISKLSPLSCK